MTPVEGAAVQLVWSSVYKIVSAASLGIAIVKSHDKKRARGHVKCHFRDSSTGS
jgi:hypothetical protein